MPGDLWTNGIVGATIASGIERFAPFSSSSKIGLETTVAAAKSTISADANLVLDTAFFTISAGSRTGMTLCLQVNDVDTALIITASASGYYVTTPGVNAVTLTPSQTVNWRINGGSGAGTSLAPVQIGCAVTHASKFYTRLGCGGGATLAVSSTTRYVQLLGAMEFVSTESLVSVKAQVTSNVEKLNLSVVSARVTDSTVVFRRNGADAGSALTIPAGFSGNLEISLTQTISPGDLVNYAATTSTGGAQALTISGIRLLAVSAANNTSAVGAGPTTAFSAARFSLPTGDISPSASLSTSVMGYIRNIGRYTNLGTRVTVMGAAAWEVAVQSASPPNSSVDTTLILGLNASATGWFDIPGAVTILGQAALYTLNTRRVSGSGNMTAALIVVTTDNPTAGTTFTKTVTGSLSFAGALTKRTARGLAGTLSFTSTLGRLKSAGKSLTGTLSFTSALGRRLAFKRTLAGQLRFQGVVRGQASKKLTGGLSLAGVLRKRTTKGLAGTLRFTSSLTRLKAFSKALTGVLSFTSALARVKSAGKLLAGTLTFQGAVTKRTAKALAGVLSFQGALSRRLALNRALTGVLSFTSVLSRVKIPGGAVFFKTLTGVLSFGSVLTSLFIDNPEPEPGADTWLMRMRRRWSRYRH